ncbi:hypothetical protein [Candidatus Chloroploca asiatica]|uniref:Uncharacterized protein n=1 Tax=Candidatus Chloroploca asiatica TaxID=1506545 RepID=A0A2H3KHB3_9CHLR|nr:hypothetical protein [Candidatus Chloroploca asiatica]PDV97154.1 hypothetical protein A9Q02_19070 [Candidatus Chloroploca asiatica]
MQAIYTSQTHDGIYVTLDGVQVKISDANLRDAITVLALHGTISDGIHTIAVPDEERTRVIQDLEAGVTSSQDNK